MVASAATEARCVSADFTVDCEKAVRFIKLSLPLFFSQRAQMPRPGRQAEHRGQNPVSVDGYVK